MPNPTGLQPSLRTRIFSWLFRPSTEVPGYSQSEPVHVLAGERAFGGSAAAPHRSARRREFVSTSLPISISLQTQITSGVHSRTVISELDDQS